LNGLKAGQLIHKSFNMRYVVFDHRHAEGKGYTYSQQQIEDILEIIKTSEHFFVYLQEPTITPSFGRVVGKLVNPEFDGNVITAELNTRQTPMGGVVDGMLSEGCESLRIVISGTGNIVDGTVRNYKLTGAFMYSQPDIMVD